MSDAVEQTPAPRRRWAGYAKAIVLALIIITLAGFREDALRAVNLLEGAVVDSDYALLFAVLIFVVGSFFFVPQWMLIAGAIAGFGLYGGSAIAWGATLVATLIHLGIGTAFQSRLRPLLDGPRWRRIERIFLRNSFQSGFLVRLVPTGPAIVVNLAAVLAGVKKRLFLLGTAVGIVPKIVLTALITQGLLSTVKGQQIGLWLSVAAIALLVLFLLNRWLKERALVASRHDGEK